MTIICSYQKSRTSWDRGGRSKQERKSQSVIFLGSGLITDLSDIKAGCCDRSALTYGSSAHTLRTRAIFAGRHIGNGFKRAAALYTNTHVENISVANGQLDLTKSPAGKKKRKKIPS